MRTTEICSTKSPHPEPRCEASRVEGRTFHEWSYVMAEITVVEQSPVGPLSVEERDGAIVAVRWRKARQESPTPLLEEAARQVRAYFARERRDFDLPLRPEGSAFEQQVWAAMQRIPYG